MRKRYFIFTVILVFTLILAPSYLAMGTKKEKGRVYFLEQVGNTQFVRIYADGFEELPLKEKLLAYYLYKAAIAGRDITYDQNHRYALEIRNILEEIITHSKGIDEKVLAKITDYTKLFWANNSNYNERTKRKFIPEVSFEEFVSAAKKAFANGADFGVKDEENLVAKLHHLKRAIFDPDYEPLVTNKSPAPPDDIITGSANNYYYNVTLKEVEAFPEKYPLNSRLAKIDGKIVEEVYRAGGDGIPPGRYARELKNVIKYLEKALPYAEGKQKETLKHLIRYFKTGDPADFRRYNISWVSDNPPVDTINGFIEVYKDARGIKGEYEALVYFVDKKRTKLMRDLATIAQYLEDRAPWKPEYKKKWGNVPVANSIAVLIGVGGAGPMSPIGINLPNAQDIREKYGSKSVLLGNIMTAANQAVGAKLTKEFALTKEEQERASRYGEIAGSVHVALHEVVGHGSGKVSPKLTKDPSEYLREYYSTMEEARADLVGLYHIWDDKLIEMGIIPNKEAAKAAYDSYVRGDLTMLRRIKSGDRIEDDHMRAHHLIVNYLKDKTKAVDVIKKDGKTYFKVNDYKKMRKGVAELLAEIMRIKAEGDYQAIKKLVNTYGIKIDTKLRDEVVARCKAINYPSYTAFVMPRLSLVRNKEGKVVDVIAHYDEDFATQMLRFSGKLKK
ncbi:MAG: peptidase M49 [Acidobacteria bacterium]|nr:peptidase M49 [Acidobacteriota bacterium]